MNLYLVRNKLNGWFVIENDPTSAQNLIENALDSEAYGASDNRKVTEIKLLAEEVGSALNSEYFFSSGKTLLIGKQQ